MDGLSDITLRCLRDAGWTPDRQVDPAPFVEAHLDAGLHVHDAGIGFLSKFGNLKLRYLKQKVPDSEDNCFFTDHALKNPDLIIDAEAAIRLPLMGIAEESDGYGILCIAKDGRGYSVFFDGTLILRGTSPAAGVT